MRPLVLLKTPVVVIAEPLLGELNLTERFPHGRELHEYLVIILPTSNTASPRPHSRKDEERLIHILEIILPLLRPIQIINTVLMLNQQPIQNRTDTLNRTHGRMRTQIGDFDLVVEVGGCVDVGLEATGEHRFGDLVDDRVGGLHGVLGGFHVGLGTLQPAVYEWHPADVVVVNEQHTAAGDRGGGGVTQVRYFEEQAHGGGEGDTIVGHKRQHLVVVHDRVQRFDPLGIHITIEDTPLMLMTLLILLLTLILVLHDHRQHSILPLLRLGIRPEQFIRCHCLGIQCVMLPILLIGDVGLEQCPPHRCLTTSRWPDDEDTMSDFEDFAQIDALLDEGLLVVQSHFGFGGVLAEFGQGGGLFGWGRGVREEVLDQT